VMAVVPAAAAALAVHCYVSLRQLVEELAAAAASVEELVLVLAAAAAASLVFVRRFESSPTVWPKAAAA
jgi:hypothetical protein